MKLIINNYVKKLESLQKDLKIVSLSKNLHFIAGFDVCYREEIALGVAILFDYHNFKLKELKTLATKINFPYISGLFSFREGPIILKLLKKLKTPPDLLLIDGHGIAHPLNMGLASYVGVKSGIPSIGCSKNSLFKNYRMPTFKKGFFTYVYHKGKKVGVCLCTKDGTKPLFVSPGHLVNIKDCYEIILSLCKKTKYPLPLWLADKIAKSQIKGKLL